MIRQIASELKLDFKTIIHHVKLLTENRLVITENKESHDILSDTFNPLMERIVGGDTG